VMIPLSGRVPGRASEPSWTRVDDGGGYRTFSGWRLRCFRVFPRMWIYRQKGEDGGRPRGPHHGAAQPGGPAPPPGVAASLPYFVSPSDSMNVSEKQELRLLFRPILRIFPSVII
jgi:hypothetical protein